MIFFNRIAMSNASTNCRNGLRDFVLKNSDTMPDLIAIGTDLNNKNHYKAVWIIEMLAEHSAKILIPFVEIICETMAHYKHESAIRGMSRVAYFLSTSKDIALTANQKEKLIEICLDWLIGDAKVAPKAICHVCLMSLCATRRLDQRGVAPDYRQRLPIAIGRI